jgi:hypothetical protein
MTPRCTEASSDIGFKPANAPRRFPIGVRIASTMTGFPTASSC